MPGTRTDEPLAIHGLAQDRRGPVLVAWDQAQASARHPERGHNVVIHEFAHKLDMLDGIVDGTPPIAASAMKPWVAVCTEVFDDLRAGRPRPPLRPYGATNPAEFFAVATEAFFDLRRRPGRPGARPLPDPVRLLRPGPLSIPMRRLDRVLWAAGDPGALGRRMADHVAGDRRCRPPARRVRLVRRARRERAWPACCYAVRRRRPRTVAASPSAARAIGGGVMGRLGTLRGAPPAHRHPRLDRAPARHRRHRQLGVLGALDRLRRRHHHRVRRVAEQLDDLAETGGQMAIVADGIDVDDPAVAARRSPPGSRRSPTLDGVIDVADPWSTGADALRATDGRAALVVVTLAGDLDEDAELAVAKQIEDLAHELDAPEVLVGGNVLVSETFATASESDLLRGEAIALPIAIVVMVVLLGGLVAAGMPLLVALGGVLTTLAVLVGATLLGDVSIFSVNVVNMLGIGLGIDYGLLMVNRFREERGHGLDVHDAVVATVAPAGTTVVFSALTVAVAMSGSSCSACRCSPRSASPGWRSCCCRMAAAVTLLPATLAASAGASSPPRRSPDVDGRFYRLARWVQGRPVVVGGAAALVLVLLGVPFLSARFENGDARTLPRSSEVRATALTWPSGSPPAAPTRSRSSPTPTPTDPAFAGLARRRSRRRPASSAPRPGRAPRRADRGRPRPRRHLQGAAGHRAGRARPRRRGRRSTSQVGGPAAELIDVKARLERPAPARRAMVVPGDARPAVPDDRFGHRADQGRAHEHPQPRAPASGPWCGSSRRATCPGCSASTRSARSTCGCRC